MLVLNLQGSFCTLPRVPAAGEPCAAGHFHLTAPLHLLLPLDPTVLTGSAKEGEKLPFVTGFSATSDQSQITSEAVL